MAKNRQIQKVAIYCRVSTDAQDTAMQLEELRRVADARGWEVAAVVEEKRSGRKLRPARQQLIREAKEGKYDAIMVWKLNRWGRSTADLVTSIRDLDAAGITFISLKDAIDMSTATGRMVADILAAIAEFEAENIKENVIAGLKHAQRHGTRSGKSIGRPNKADEHAIEVRALRSQGLSLPVIAEKTGLGYGTVHRLVAARHK
jgi:putative DNA-invertase from lambdoid prophage Rac